MIFEDYKKNFSIKEMKKILIGCALFQKIREHLGDQASKYLNVPKILKNKYFS